MAPIVACSAISVSDRSCAGPGVDEHAHQEREGPVESALLADGTDDQPDREQRNRERCHLAQAKAELRVEEETARQRSRPSGLSGKFGIA